MKRMRWAGGSLAVVGLVLASCGSSGSSASSEEDFIDDLNGVCSDVNRGINRLDPDDNKFFDDALDVLQTGADDLAELKPPKDLEDDFNDLADNLDDTISETENLRDAVDDEDSEAIADSSDELSNLSEDANDLADSLGADDCVDIGNGAAGPDTTADVPDDSTPVTPLPINSDPPETDPPETDPPATDAPATDAPVTSPPITNPPITNPPVTTVPVSTPTPTTMTPMTAPPSAGDGLALDASVDWAPPTGFEWAPLDDLSTVATPAADPVLGPVVSAYWSGLIQNPTTGEQGIVYISELNTPAGTPWTAEQLTALFSFEAVEGGTDITTPTYGLDARVAFKILGGQLDGALFYVPNNSVSILAPTGTDIVSILDLFFAANSMGG